MKRFFLVIFALIPVFAFAATNYVFVINTADNDKLISSFTTTRSVKNNTGVAGRVNVLPNKTQFEAGYANLPPGLITSAKAKASTNRANRAKIKDKTTMSAIIVMMDEINTLRATNGLSQYTTNQWNALIRGELP